MHEQGTYQNDAGYYLHVTKCQSGRSEGRQNSSADGGPEVKLQFEEGIEKTVCWYLENEEWLNNITSGEYEKYYEEQYKDR